MVGAPLARTRKGKYTIRYPVAIELSLARAYRDFARELAQVTADEVKPVLAALTQQAYRYRRDADDDPDDDDLDDDSDRKSYLALLILALRRVISRMSPRVRPLLNVAMRHASQTNTQSVREFEAALKHDLGISVIPRDAWLEHELKAFETENLRLIRSISQQHVDKLRGKVVEALRMGQGPQQLAQILQDQAGVTERRAMFIGTDQIGKLFAQMNMLRQQAVGVSEYEWRGVMDARERPLHVAREGQTFSWSDPPSDGHPGYPPNCRCAAWPVWPDIKDIEGTILPPGA